MLGVAPSVAVQVTFVVPKEKTVPEAGAHETVGVPTLSVAVGVANVTVAPAELVASATTGGGVALNVGGVVSVLVRVTSKCTSDGFVPSDAVHET